MAVVKAKPTVAGQYRKVSSFVERQLPAFYEEIGSQLIPFVKAYYRWMEQDKHIISDIYNLTANQNHRTTDDERFWNAFKEEFLPSIPADFQVDKRLLLEHIREFYRSRGSVQSFEFLFKILFNTAIEVSYPGETIFRSSDGVWQKKTFLKIEVFDPAIESIEARKIIGVQSGATAIVETFTLFSGTSTQVAVVEITKLNGTFIPDEAIETRDDETPFIGRLFGQVSSYVINNPGTGYVEGEFLPVTGGGGENFVAFINSVDINGGIVSVKILDTGYGYSSAPVVDMGSLSGTGGAITLLVSGTHFSDGQYLDDRGQPSSTSRLQDGRIYQDYSYIIKTNVPSEAWSDILKRLVHPAGMALFTENSVYRKIETNVTASSYIETTGPVDLIVNINEFAIPLLET